MVVDRAWSLRDVVVSGLRWNGFRVVAAVDCATAIEEFTKRSHPIRVVVIGVDIALPEGLELLRQIAQVDADVRCCFLRSGGRSFEVDMLTNSTRSVLTMPFTWDEVLGVVQRLAAE